MTRVLYVIHGVCEDIEMEDGIGLKLLTNLQLLLLLQGINILHYSLVL